MPYGLECRAFNQTQIKKLQALDKNVTRHNKKWIHNGEVQDSGILDRNSKQEVGGKIKRRRPWNGKRLWQRILENEGWKRIKLAIAWDGDSKEHPRQKGQGDNIEIYSQPFPFIINSGELNLIELHDYNIYFPPLFYLVIYPTTRLIIVISPFSLFNSRNRFIYRFY